MEQINNIDLNILDNELKRLHEQLMLVAADKEMRNRILDMIENLHKANFVAMYSVRYVNGEEIW